MTIFGYDVGKKGLPCIKAIIHRRFAIQIAKESKLKCVCNVIYHKRHVLII